MAAVTTDALLHETRARHHARCWVCGQANTHGLDVLFRSIGGGEVEGTFACSDAYAGYDGLLHGGVISSLLDGAMTNCLMARGMVGLTVELRVRFRRPVLTGRPAPLRAHPAGQRGPVARVAAELWQEGELLVTAEGKFLPHPQQRWTARAG